MYVGDFSKLRSVIIILCGYSIQLEMVAKLKVVKCSKEGVWNMTVNRTVLYY